MSMYDDLGLYPQMDSVYVNLDFVDDFNIQDIQELQNKAYNKVQETVKMTNFEDIKTFYMKNILIISMLQWILTIYLILKAKK